jgi:transcriptional regulator, tetR family
MSRGSPEQTQARRDEILNAMEQLLEQRSYRDISMRVIEEQISVTRSHIYNYFKIREEIVLGLVEREYRSWFLELNALEKQCPTDAEQFAEGVASSLEHRQKFLHLLSWNARELEENSRTEALASLQQITSDTIQCISRCAACAVPQLSGAEEHIFVYSFFTYLY